MKQATASRSGRRHWALLRYLALALGMIHVPAVAQQPRPAGESPAKLTDAERARRLQERDRYRNEALRLANSGRWDDAIREAEASLAIERKQSGNFSDDVAESLAFLAQVHEGREDWAAARTRLQDILALRERQPGRKKWRVAEAGLALADLNRRAAMTPGQRQLLRTGRQLHKKGRALMDKAQYSAAEAPMCDAIQIFKDLLGADHPDHAKGLNNLGSLYHVMGDFARAEPVFRQAIEIWKKAGGEGYPRYATGLNNLSSLYHDMGDDARVEPLLRESIEITKRAVGERDPDYALSLNNLGRFYTHIGAYARAEPLLRQATEITKEAVGEGHPDYAVRLTGLGLLYLAMGDYVRAEPLLRESMEITKKAVGESHPDYAVRLNNLGLLYSARGDSARAEPLLRQAMAITKEALGRGHPDYAVRLNILGLLYRTTGDYTRAEPLLHESMEITKRAVGEGHPDYAKGLNNLGVLYKDMGEYARAEPLLRQAMEIWKKVLGEGHPDYARILSNLGFLYLAMGDSVRSELWSREAVERTNALFLELAPALAERPRMELLWSLRFALHGYLSAAQQAGVSPEAMYRRVLDWKGAVFCQLDDRGIDNRPEMRPFREELASVRAQLARLALTTPAPGQRDRWRKQLRALRERKEELEADLGRKSASYRPQKLAAQVGPEKVAAVLPVGAALIDLIAYRHFSLPQGAKGKLRSDLRLLAFVVRRDRPVSRIALGPSGSIDGAVKAWRRAIVTDRAELLRQAADELGRRLWEPIQPHLAGTSTALISSDGWLMHFPFAALPGRKPGSYLIEDLAIGYVGSGREAVALMAPEEPAAGGLLAAGAIDFQGDPGGAVRLPLRQPQLVVAAKERAGLAPLPGTRREGELARDLFRRAFPDQPAVLLTGGEPTEGEIKRRLDGGHWRAVHLATHGFFESPDRIAALRAAVRREQPFALAPEPGQPDDDAATFVLTPFLRSGVVLAGGGRAPDSNKVDPTSNASPEDDGILTAEEVQSLDLRGTELVVLSACQTGLGRRGRAGQGVLGLQRAFHSAGARAVVASLWKVDDAATTVLMEQFYTNLWSKKMPRLEALRQAQLTVLNNPALVTARRAELAKQRGIDDKPEKLPDGGRIAPPGDRPSRSNPAHWAAFVLSGDVR